MQNQKRNIYECINMYIMSDWSQERREATGEN